MRPRVVKKRPSSKRISAARRAFLVLREMGEVRALRSIALPREGDYDYDQEGLAS
jgi:hypothetical protein